MGEATPQPEVHAQAIDFRWGWQLEPSLLASKSPAAQPMPLIQTSSLTARLAHWILLATVSLSVAQAGTARAGLSSVEKLYVFGDSLSDSGNSGVLSGGTFPAPPYFENRFSNGKVAVEYLWDILNPGNSTFTASLVGGSNYAVGGSSSGKVNSVEQAAYDNKGIAWQLATFQASNPQFNPNTSLFVVRGPQLATASLATTAEARNPSPGSHHSLQAVGARERRTRWRSLRLQPNNVALARNGRGAGTPSAWAIPWANRAWPRVVGCSLSQ